MATGNNAQRLVMRYEQSRLRRVVEQVADAGRRLH